MSDHFSKTMYSNPRTILFIASRSGIAGGENYLLSVLRHLDLARFKPIVWVPGEGAFTKTLREQGVEFVVEEVNYGWLKPQEAWYKFLRGLPDRVRRLIQVIRERQVSLVHTNSNIILEGAFAAQVAGSHHIHLAHLEFLEDNPVYQRFRLDKGSYARLIGDLSTHVIAVSASVMKSLTPPLSAGQVQVINNGLELDTFDRAVDAAHGSVRKSLGVARDEVLITAAGRIHPDKGFDLLVEAAGKLLHRFPSAKFVIAGKTESKPHAEELSKRAQALGIGERFRLLGMREDLPRILADSDIFVLPSRFEGHPFVLLEAMACKCPAVASRCGGVEETIVDGVSGYIVDVGNVDALFERLLALCEHPEDRHRMAEAARARVHDRFDAIKMVDSLMEAYDRVLADPPPAAGSWAVHLLLQGATEISALGLDVVQLEERMKRAERLATLLMDNPLAKAARRVARTMRPSS